MHAAHELLDTLATVLGVAASTSVVFQRLRRSAPVVFRVANGGAHAA